MVPRWTIHKISTNEKSRQRTPSLFQDVTNSIQFDSIPSQIATAVS